MILKKYQRRAVDELKKCYENRKAEGECLLHAPTGSGKTVIIENFISEILARRDKKIVFFFISFRPKLIEQSIRRITNSVSDIKTVDDFMTSGLKISDGEVWFINWEKVNKGYGNLSESTDTSTSLKDAVSNTDDITKILIIDEAHTHRNTDKSKGIIATINPELIIDVTATPLADQRKRMSSDAIVTVSKEDVMMEQMLRKGVVYNDGIQDGMLLLDAGYARLRTLQDLFRAEGSKVKPLMLIQIPDGGNAAEFLNVIQEWAVGKDGIRNDVDEEIQGVLKLSTMENDDIADFNSPVSVIVFKQKKSTGWDCPRSIVLVKFRAPSDSEFFDEQVSGRLARCPEQKHYDNDDLNYAYVYSNILNIDKNSVPGKGKNIFVPLYVKRASGKFSLRYEHYDIKRTQGIIPNNLLASKEIDPLLDDAIRIVAGYPKEQLRRQLRIDDSEGSILAHWKDERAELNRQMIKSLGNRAMTYVKIVELEMLARLEEKIHCGNQEAYIRLMTDIRSEGPIKEFFKAVKEKVAENDERRETMTKAIYAGVKDGSVIKTYSGEGAFRRLVEKPGFDLEVKLHYAVEAPFAEQICSRSDVAYWVKNGDSGKDNFSIPYVSSDGKKHLFFPDFIVKFKNGKTGIYDTKGEFTTASDENYEPTAKYEALNAYVNAHEGTVGGFVVYSGGKWLLFSGDKYENAFNDNGTVSSNWLDI